MARKFLYFVAFCIVLVIAGRIAYELFQEELAQIALVPSAEFTPIPPLQTNAYEDPTLWFSRPGIGVSDPARWQPAWAGDSEPVPALTKTAKPFAVFFVHPTSYLNRTRWNAPSKTAAIPKPNALPASICAAWRARSTPRPKSGRRATGRPPWARS